MTPSFWIIGFFVLAVILLLTAGAILVMIRRARQGLSERKYFFDSTSDLIAILDDSLIVREINRAIRVKLRMAPGEGIGEKIENTLFWPLPAEERRLALKSLQAALRGERALFNMTMTDKDSIPVKLEVRAYLAGAPRFGRRELICYSRDVTAELSARHRLKRRTEMEKIIARMMEATFSDGDSRKRVPSILEMAGKFLRARRAFLFQTDREGNIAWEHLWSAPGVPHLEDGWNGFNVAEMMPFNMGGQEMTVLSNLAENPGIPAEARSQAESSGMGSLVFITLMGRNRATCGYAGFTFSEVRPPEDSSSEILLQLLSSTMSGLLTRVDDQRDIRMFRESLNAAGQGIAMINNEGKVTYANGTYQSMTGHTPETPWPIWEHYVGSCSEKVENFILPLVSSGQAWTGELRIQEQDGDLVDTIESFVPVEMSADDPVYIINMITDISDRKKLEDQLIKARKEAEIANRAKSDYLANMSHEIRTPMNAVIGLAYLALQTELDSRQRDYLSKINIAARGLLNIINDILDLSKIEAGRLELENVSFSLDEVMEGVLDMAAETAAKKGLRLLYHRPPEIPDIWVGDRFRLSQVLLNLVGNAVKFTSEGRVTVGVKTGVPGYLRFSVEDTGIGMTPEQISRLFTPFEQAELSTSRQFGGTGLGLTISKQIVELMKGTISVSSEPEKGSRFEFNVAMVRDTESGGESPDNEDSIGEAFIICGDEPARDFHSNALQAAGYRTQAFGTVKDVLENPDLPDLLLIDIDDCRQDIRSAAYALTDGAADGFVLVLTGSRDEDELAGFAPQGIQSLALRMPYGRNRLKDSLEELTSGNTNAPEEAAPRVGTIIRGRILLADDNSINRQVGEELLASAGMEVDVARDGREAVDFCRKETYTLVFMDLHMPHMDGYEATRIIRDDYPDLPIIAMTASTLNDVKAEIMDAGFTGYIPKPVDPDRVFRILSEKLSVPESHFHAAVRRRDRKKDETRSIEGINETEALKRVFGDRDKLELIQRTFADHHEKDVTYFREGPDGEIREEFIRRLHTLRGSSGNIGATTLMKSAGMLEDRMRKEGEVPSGDYEDLAAELSSLISGIRKTTERRSLDSRLFDELEEMIRDSDDAAGRYLEDNISPLAAVTDSDHIERIRSALDRWDFDEALDAVDDWRVVMSGKGE